MNDDLRVVFESSNRFACAERALVLAALKLPHEVVQDGNSFVLVVPADVSARASEEIWLFDEENPPPVAKARKRLPNRNAVPGVLAYVIFLITFAGLESASSFGQNWIAAGGTDGALIRSGEWWRPFTALTLHSGLRHLVGNLIFGTLFGIFAGRLLGSGVAWLAIVFAGASGNLFNTLLLDSTHRSIGASTAVFAALGLVAGFVWRGKLMPQERWSYRAGPIVGGLALLMYTGTGDAKTDIGAHLLGFVSGFIGGMLLTLVSPRFFDHRFQVGAGAAAIFTLAIAWLFAFGGPTAVF